MKFRFLYLLAVICLMACSENDEVVINKFSDPEMVRIYDFKDRRLSDSLYPYFNHASAAYRRDAALAFASIQDSNAVEKLWKLFMREPEAQVRRAIAFAYGQTPSQETERTILGAIIKEKDNSVLTELLESYGKVTSHWHLIHTTFLSDTVKSSGLAWSIYRGGLRERTDTATNSLAKIFLTEGHSYSAQLAASHFFARGAKSIGSAFDRIAEIAINNPSADLRMTAIASLKKITDGKSFAVIKKSIETDKDYRVRVNAIRALQFFPFEDTKSVLYSALYDKQANVGIAASEVIRDVASKENWIELANLTSRTDNWRIQANLYEAALTSENSSVKNEIIGLYRNSNNPFQKAALLNALKSDATQFEFLRDQLLDANTPVIRSAAAASLASIIKDKPSDLFYKQEFISLCQKGMTLNDPAVTGILAEVLADPKLNFKPLVKDFTFLINAKNQLSLPKDNEALQPLEAAIAYFYGKEAAQVTNEFNNPIDWNLVKTIPTNQEAVIKTTRGHIKIRLLVDEAPGSVCNFVKLAKANYFDKKIFHRVVPNFVVQAGCNRGDGWGSEDYSIRSEFSQRRYTTGSVGMASAGKDTEGTQWFITHSPTPHLDGRYTIFAEVVEGMSAVHLIEVGDQIIDVELKK